MVLLPLGRVAILVALVMNNGIPALIPHLCLFMSIDKAMFSGDFFPDSHLPWPALTLETEVSEVLGLGSCREFKEMAKCFGFAITGEPTVRKACR